jgi:Domain of unknown function (DUF4203)
MKDIVLGLVAILVGAIFCFRGYFAMRIIIPIWGAFAGFMLGAGVVSSSSGDDFLRTALAWIVGLAVAVVFGLIAYLYYAVAVVLGMAAIGFVLGTGVMAFLGVRWSWLVILVGVITAGVLAFVAIVGDMPMVLLTVLTALAGATVITSGIMLLVGAVDTADFDAGGTTESVNDDWWWYAIYGGLAVIGIVVQWSTNAERQATLREEWYRSVDPTTSSV